MQELHVHVPAGVGMGDWRVRWYDGSATAERKRDGMRVAFALPPDTEEAEIANEVALACDRLFVRETPRSAADVAHDLRTARERVEQLGSIVIGGRTLSEILDEAAKIVGGDATCDRLQKASTPSPCVCFSLAAQDPAGNEYVNKHLRVEVVERDGTATVIGEFDSSGYGSLTGIEARVRSTGRSEHWHPAGVLRTDEHD